MSTLAFYDVTGIQEFIFSSPKAVENVGASIIVQQLFEDDLIAALPTNSVANWREEVTFKMPSDNGPDAVVVFTGGGNAIVLYKNFPTAKAATEELSKTILERTGGALRFVVAYQDPTTENFLKDRNAVIDKIKKSKFETFRSQPLLGIAITREGETDGLPAVERDLEKGQFLSRSASNNRKVAQRGAEGSEEDYFYDLLPDPGEYKFPLEFDKLGQNIGENHIAVVHIDGNDMGSKLNDLLERVGDTSYKSLVPQMGKNSKAVDEAFQQVLKETIAQLERGFKLSKPFVDQLHLRRNEKGATLLPIRPVVRNGDEVTFVCHGRLGVPLAELFLKKLYGLEENQYGLGFKFTACAGVAIVKSHFPFYRAYQLATELCKSAKTRAKILAKKNDTEDNIGCWLDYHIVYSGITTTLSEIRQKFYQVPGMDPPAAIEHTEYGIVHMTHNQYNLLWRPWRVAGEQDERYKWYDWNELMEIYRAFHDEKKNWSHSRLKTLRNTMVKSKGEIGMLTKQYKSRDCILPKFLDNSEVFKSYDNTENQTPYYDDLELLDFYLKKGQPQTQDGFESFGAG